MPWTTRSGVSEGAQGISVGAIVLGPERKNGVVAGGERSVIGPFAEVRTEVRVSPWFKGPHDDSQIPMGKVDRVWSMPRPRVLAVLPPARQETWAKEPRSRRTRRPQSSYLKGDLPWTL